MVFEESMAVKDNTVTGDISIKKAASKIRKATKLGAILGGTAIRRDGMKITPVDTGNLVNSWYGPIVEIATVKKLLVTFGLTAEYAPYVHEMMKASFRKPGAKAKFLEEPVLQHKKNVVRLIRIEIKKVLK